MILSFALLIPLTACGDSDDSANTTTTPAPQASTTVKAQASTTDPEKVPTSPGSPEVYQRIFALKDCAALQKEINDALNNTQTLAPGTEQRKWFFAYGKYADDRRKQLGCSG